MSKLADAIRRTQRVESTPMGFGAARPAAKATMLVGYVAANVAAVEKAKDVGSDVILTQSAGKAVSAAGAGKLQAGAGDAVLGIWAKIDASEIEDLHKSGVEFFVLDPEVTPASVLLNEDVGYVLVVPKEPEEVFLRSLEPISLDALFLSEVPAPLTVTNQIELTRIGALARKPLICTVTPDIAKEDLQCLRAAGVVLVLVEGDAAGVTRLKQTVIELPARRQRRDDRPVVSLPRGQAAPEPDDDDDDDDDD